MWHKNKRGPKTVPWGTPESTDVASDVTPSVCVCVCVWCVCVRACLREEGGGSQEGYKREIPVEIACASLSYSCFVLFTN